MKAVVETHSVGSDTFSRVFVVEVVEGNLSIKHGGRHSPTLYEDGWKTVTVIRDEAADEGIA